MVDFRYIVIMRMPTVTSGGSNLFVVIFRTGDFYRRGFSLASLYHRYDALAFWKKLTRVFTEPVFQTLVFVLLEKQNLLFCAAFTPVFYMNLLLW